MGIVHIRWMIRRDMAAVLKIEKNSYTRGWSEDDFVNVLQQRNCIGMVAEVDETVVGYMIYLLEKKDIVLLNLTVADEHRRNGYGLAMIDKLKGKLTAMRRNRLIMEVCEDNLTAQVFLSRMGLKVRKIKPNPEKRGKDIYRMIFDIEQQSEPKIVNRLLKKKA